MRETQTKTPLASKNMTSKQIQKINVTIDEMTRELKKALMQPRRGPSRMDLELADLHLTQAKKHLFDYLGRQAPWNP